MNKQKNVQQQVDTERKKEQVSVLEKIRRRTGLLVSIVGVALLIFILESLLGSGASIFGGSDLNYAGSINGKKIDRNEFLMKFENQLNNYRQRNQGRDVDESTKTQVIEGIWQQYIIDLVMKPQFNKIGIAVGDDELYESVVVNPAQSIIQNLTDPNTGKINEQFSRPDGSLDPLKWRQAVQNVTGENEMAVRSMEEQVKDSRYFEKFRALITKGLYVTKAEAKQNYQNQNQKRELSYIIKRFDSVSDTVVKVTDSDIQKYYKEHSYQYMNSEATRSAEYVVFNVLPSKEDLAEIENDAQRVASEFKGLSVRDDSSFMAQESENGSIMIQNFTKKSMIIRDSSVFTSAAGTVFGPYNEGAYFKIYKLQGINSMADSARIRHILVGINDAQQKPKRSLEQAKNEADSILVLLKAKKVSFDSLVVNYSDDGGSKTNGGDYGWFDENEGFVEQFKNAGLMGSKGNISVVETQFGYHIIEVLDVSKTRHNSYRVAQIFKLIGPSDETNQRVFATANQFAGENNTAELFDKAVVAQKLIPRMANNIKEGNYQVSGLDGAKELVKWAFNANKGDVTIFTMTDKHVVAKLSGIKNQGLLPLEEVKDDVTMKATQAKKAEMFTEEFKNKAGNDKSIEAIAGKLGLEVRKSSDLIAQQNTIEGVGPDNIMVGTAIGTKAGALSKITTGINGVFVLAVNSVEKNIEMKDYTNQMKDMERELNGRADSDSFYALKEMSDIEFHKSRID
ncbi:peptidylprolyl isomerase [Aurantibacillus circumpalustris]|uniref:peptidylprolyl isomerase n=1 Tax=Aurantibacillus circumpalustris TaxID=3036359 RepID=UPI00295BF6D2|nr:SurA N-terminal domain-containing protein [Aurantibacillus circumpalustris]